jgi:hypothetical protein
MIYKLLVGMFLVQAEQSWLGGNVCSVVLHPALGNNTFAATTTTKYSLLLASCHFKEIGYRDFNEIEIYGMVQWWLNGLFDL